MARKKTHEEFVKEVYNLFGDEYTILGNYINSLEKIEILHNKCGFKYKVLPNNLLKKSRCPKCYGNHKKTTEYFKKEVYELVKDEYSVLGEYINAQTKIKMKHNKCGYEFSVYPASFLSGKRCRKCAGNTKKTTDDFKKEVFNLVKNEYSVLGEYINARTKIKMRHNICGFEYEVKPSVFTSQGNRCPFCDGKNKNTNRFKAEVFDLVKNEYEVLGEYKNSQTKILMKHNSCGYEWLVTPNNFLKGRRCPKCSISNITSKGEDVIANVLNELNIKYVREYRFKNCRNKLPLPFDFALFKEKKLIALIEYQGRQHFEPVEAFGGDENLAYTKNNDLIKKEYCKKNNIKLIEIPYWEFDNIEKIINKELKRLIKASFLLYSVNIS